MKTQHKGKKCQVHTNGRLRQQTARFLDFVLRLVLGKTNRSFRKWTCSSHQAKGRSRKIRQMIVTLSQGHNCLGATHHPFTRRRQKVHFPIRRVLSPKSTNRVILRNCVICATAQLQNEVTSILYRGYRFSTGRVLQETLKCSFTFRV